MEKIAKKRRGKRDFSGREGFLWFKIFEAGGLAGFLARGRIAGLEVTPVDVEVVVVVSRRA
jgi:hypothetical protein